MGYGQGCSLSSPKQQQYEPHVGVHISLQLVHDWGQVCGSLLCSVQSFQGRPLGFGDASEAKKASHHAGSGVFCVVALA